MIIFRVGNLPIVVFCAATWLCAGNLSTPKNMYR